MSLNLLDPWKVLSDLQSETSNSTHDAMWQGRGFKPRHKGGTHITGCMCVGVCARVRVPMCAHMYAGVNLCVGVCICVLVYVYVCGTCACIWTCMHMCVWYVWCVLVYVQINACMCVWCVHMHIHVYAYVGMWYMQCIHVCVHECMNVCIHVCVVCMHMCGLM